MMLLWLLYVYSGSSIELSADGPIRPPYEAYVQGGLTYEHVKIAVTRAVNQLKEQGLYNRLNFTLNDNVFLGEIFLLRFIRLFLKIEKYFSCRLFYGVLKVKLQLYQCFEFYVRKPDIF